MSTLSFLAALAPLGASYTVTFMPVYGDDGATVTLTIFAKPKEGVKNVREKHLQLAGPVAEVEKQIAGQLPAAVRQIVDHTQSLAAQAEAQVAAEKKEAEEKAAAKASAKDKPAAPASAKSKSARAAKPAPASPAVETASQLPLPASGSAAPGLTAAERAVLELATTDESQAL